MESSELDKEHGTPDRRQIIRKNAKIFFEGRENIPFECHDGWLTLISDVVLDIEALNVMAKKYGVSLHARQIKEKFGQLRVYYESRTVPVEGFTSDEQNVMERYFSRKCDDITVKAEDRSAHVCEMCGSVDGVVLKERNGWWSSLCGKCGHD